MTGTDTREPFTQHAAVALWNEASGLSLELEPWWRRGRRAAAMARAHGPVGVLAITLFEHGQGDKTPYLEHVKGVKGEDAEGPFAYQKPDKVTLRDAIGAAAIIATAAERPVALAVAESVSLTVNPGEWPADAVSRLAPQKVAVDEVGSGFLGNPHWQS